MEIKGILNIGELLINKFPLKFSINFLGFFFVLLLITPLTSLCFLSFYKKNTIKLHNVNKYKQNEILKNIERNLAKFDIITEENSNIKVELMKELNFLQILKLNFKLMMIPLKLHLLRIYINRSLNRILIDVEVRKVVKSEILKAPGGTFSEFLKLHNEIIAELNRISQMEEYLFEDPNE